MPEGSCAPFGCWMVIVFAQASSAAFLAILFLQSGLDKVFDWNGNMEWLTGHFSKSPVAGFVAPMLAVVTALELTAGALSAVGAVAALFGSTTLAMVGAGVAVVALLQLFFGQRLAKDYAGAAVLVPYFIFTQLTLLLLTVRP